MSYSEKVIDHYNEPRNVGSLDKNDPNVGTGLVGSPNCGDVMKLNIKVDEEGYIEDAKFKTFGCLAGNSRICTPFGYKRIRDLKVYDAVWAWDGTEIVTNSIMAIKESEWDISDLLKIKFESSMHPLICSKEHVWWGADNKPVLASDLSVGDELLEMTTSELRSLNNIGRRSSELREKNSKRMYEFNKTLDRSELPQNQKGYKQKESEKRSLAAKTNWLMRPEYRKNWQEGMAKIDWKERPTKLEKKFIELFEEHGIDARYVGDYSFWHNKANPDFKVNGQNKFIEVYDSKMPWQDRSGEEWKKARAEQLGVYGFKTLFLDVRDMDNCIAEVQRFIHNGSKVLRIENIKDNRSLRGAFNQDEKSAFGRVKLYDLSLYEGANIFFVDRVMSHNCGSAIASSSLATEWIKGKTIDEAESIKNTEIVEELSLPPVKIHCSLLAEDAIKAAIADYRKKQESLLIDEISDSVASDLDVYESKPE